MDRWKEKLCLEHTWYLYLCVFLLLAFISWQQSLIADLQERMMNVEASRYDEHRFHNFSAGNYEIYVHYRGNTVFAQE